MGDQGEHSADNRPSECKGVEFYRIVRASFTPDEFEAMARRAETTIRVAKIRGLIPWENDGEREQPFHFEFPEPPQWGEAA